MRVERPDLRRSGRIRSLSYRGGPFRELLLLHDAGTPAERLTLEPLIFSKAIDRKRDVKHGKISADPIIEALLVAYKARVKQPSTHS